MAYYAKLDENNVVLAVEPVDNSILVDDNEELGREWQEAVHGWANWKRTSFNTFENKHFDPNTGQLSPDQSHAFRGNFATIGGSYDAVNDLFFPPKPYPSWTKDVANAKWVSPTPIPSEMTYEEGGETLTWLISWNEDALRWQGKKQANLNDEYYWDNTTSAWILIS